MLDFSGTTFRNPTGVFQTTVVARLIVDLKKSLVLKSRRRLRGRKLGSEKRTRKRGREAITYLMNPQYAQLSLPLWRKNMISRLHWSDRPQKQLSQLTLLALRHAKVRAIILEPCHTAKAGPFIVHAHLLLIRVLLIANTMKMGH